MTFSRPILHVVLLTCWGLVMPMFDTHAAPVQLSSQVASGPFSKETLDREAEVALTAVGESRCIKLWGEIPVKFASRQQLESAMRAEQGSFFSRFAGSAGHTELDIRQTARWILAKYSVREKAILVVPENFVRQARGTGEAWLLENATLRMYLVHEAAHAADDFQWNLGKRLTNAKDAEALQALSAVMEGHAQLTARRVCEQKGWMKSFERMASFIGSTRGELRIARQQLAPVRWPTTASIYRDGEAFMTTVLAEGGSEAVARAFRTPPEDLLAISRPEWFLDPDTQAPLVYDFKGALNYVAGGFDLKQWTQVRSSATPSQLRDSLQACRDEELDSWLRGLVRNRTASFKPRVSPESKVVGATLFQHATTRHATDAVALKEADSRRKNAGLAKAAQGRVSHSDYQAVEGDSCRGFVCSKRLRLLNVEAEMVHVVLSSGPVEVELMSWGGAVSRPILVGLAKTVLNRCESSVRNDD